MLAERIMDNHRNNCCVCKNCADVSPPKHTRNKADFRIPCTNFVGSFAAGTLYTHMHVSTDIHLHTLISIMSSEPHSDTRSKKAAKARIDDPLWSCKG